MKPGLFLHSIIMPLIMAGMVIESLSAQDAPDTLRLRDYKPKSIYVIPVTKVEKAKYPIIDMHSHAYADGEEEIAQWVQNMNDAGIEKTIILTGLTGTKFDSVYALYSKYPARFELWCGFDYTGFDKPGYGPTAVKELERCAKVGAKGVGELSDKGKGMRYRGGHAQDLHFNDPRLAPLLEKCGQLGLPINIHVAEPIWMYEPMDINNDGLMNAFEWRLDNQDVISHAGMMEVLEDAVRKHPGTTFIACHFANLSYDLNQLGALLSKYPNLFADISARYAETAPIPRHAAKFITEHMNKLVYGTDMGFDKDMYMITFRILETEDEHFYETSQFGYHWSMHGFGLSARVLKKLYRQNALKIIGD